MPILNYTTSISTEKTAAEIQKKLAGAKAQAVMCEYDDDGIMSAMSFRIKSASGILSFRLPSNMDGVYKSLCNNNKVPARLQTHEQAARVAWRILKVWVEAQIAIIEAQMADIEEIFLPYVQDPTGKTLYEIIKDNGYKLLTDPRDLIR